MKSKYFLTLMTIKERQHKKEITKMKATIKKIELKEFTAKRGENAGKKFKKLVITCDVRVDDKGVIKTYKASLSEAYAKKYFEFCGKKTRDVIGEECEVSLQKREYTDGEGLKRQLTEIRFFNLLNEDGQAIIMPKDEEATPINW